MPRRIRIGSMNVATTETTMYNAFDNYGTITSHSIERDAAGASLGVGHVEYTTAAAGNGAIAAKHNTYFDGATITVIDDDPPT